MGTWERAGPALSDAREDEVEHPRGGTVATCDGLNLYASDRLDGADRELMERLCRYLLRGPLALSRLKRRDDGMLTYRMKKADRRGNTILVLTPVQLLMRLCSLVPAPRSPTRKYFGILAAGSPHRKRVVPAPSVRRVKHTHTIGPRQKTAASVDWATLLARVWGIDAVKCLECGGRTAVIAVVQDREQAARFLGHIGDATEHPRVRGPPTEWAA